MKKSIALILALIMAGAFFGCAEPAIKAEEVVNEYFEEFYKASPDDIDKLIHKSNTKEDAKSFYTKVAKLVEKKYGDTLSDKFINKQFVGNRLFLESPQMARSQEANMSLSEIEIKNVIEKEEDFYFNFEGKVKVDYIKEKEDLYLFIKGQIRITKDGRKYKVHGITYFNDETSKYRYN